MTPSAQEIFGRLQAWFQKRCDGDWEHGNGIRIYTIDNPGWRVKIDLVDTPLEREPFASIKIDRTDSDWMQCWIEDSVFNAAGGVGNLTEMLAVFLDWATLPTEKG